VAGNKKMDEIDFSVEKTVYSNKTEQGHKGWTDIEGCGIWWTYSEINLWNII